VVSSFYQQALQADDQLRQRTAFALSQIFVVSTATWRASARRPSASYTTCSRSDAFGNFRTLLQDVAMHPAMGLYLSHLKNKKEDLALGRVPDQNFAREVMQLFSIGLAAAEPRRARPSWTATAARSKPTARPTSRAWPRSSPASRGTAPTRWNALRRHLRDPDRLFRPMQGYPQFHSTLEKRFLGTVVARSASGANPRPA
jgi:uncharacterized protein (DUF1800 family)